MCWLGPLLPATGGQLPFGFGLHRAVARLHFLAFAHGLAVAARHVIHAVGGWVNGRSVGRRTSARHVRRSTGLGAGRRAGGYGLGQSGAGGEGKGGGEKGGFHDK